MKIRTWLVGGGLLVAGCALIPLMSRMRAQDESGTGPGVVGPGPGGLDDASGGTEVGHVIDVPLVGRVIKIPGESGLRLASEPPTGLPAKSTSPAPATKLGRPSPAGSGTTPGNRSGGGSAPGMGARKGGARMSGLGSGGMSSMPDASMPGGGAGSGMSGMPGVMSSPGGMGSMAGSAGMGMGGLGGMMMGGAMNEDAEQETATNHLLAVYIQSEDAEERSAVRSELSKVFEQIFELRQQRRMQELQELESRVRKFRGTLEAREQQKAEIVKSRLEYVLREADGLGWGDGAPSGAASGLGGGLSGGGAGVGPGVR